MFFSPILLKADELINKFDEETVPILNDEMRKVRNDLEDKVDCAHRQDNTTNNTISGVVIEHGWGFIQGDATSDITEAITFSSAFTNIPVVIVSYCGKTAVLPNSLDDFGTPYPGITTAMPHTITTTGFTVYMSAESGVTSFPNTDYFGYVWWAVGSK